MSRTFTLVPDDVLAASRDFLGLVAHDPAVLVVVDATTKVFFAGEPSVARNVADGEGLAGLELLAGDGFFRLATSGSRLSIEHLSRYLDVIVKAYACRVTDDRTGEDLTHQARTDPQVLLAG